MGSKATFWLLKVSVLTCAAVFGASCSSIPKPNEPVAQSQAEVVAPAKNTSLLSVFDKYTRLDQPLRPVNLKKASKGSKFKLSKWKKKHRAQMLAKIRTTAKLDKISTSQSQIGGPPTPPPSNPGPDEEWFSHPYSGSPDHPEFPAIVPPIVQLAEGEPDENEAGLDFLEYVSSGILMTGLGNEIALPQSTVTLEDVYTITNQLDGAGYFKIDDPADRAAFLQQDISMLPAHRTLVAQLEARDAWPWINSWLKDCGTQQYSGGGPTPPAPICQGKKKPTQQPSLSQQRYHGYWWELVNVAMKAWKAQKELLKIRMQTEDSMVRMWELHLRPDVQPRGLYPSEQFEYAYLYKRYWVYDFRPSDYQTMPSGSRPIAHKVDPAEIAWVYKWILFDLEDSTKFNVIPPATSKSKPVFSQVERLRLLDWDKEFRRVYSMANQGVEDATDLLETYATLGQAALGRLAFKGALKWAAKSTIKGGVKIIPRFHLPGIQALAEQRGLATLWASVRKVGPDDELYRIVGGFLDEPGEPFILNLKMIFRNASKTTLRDVVEKSTYAGLRSDLFVKELVNAASMFRDDPALYRALQRNPLLDGLSPTELEDGLRFVSQKMLREMQVVKNADSLRLRYGPSVRIPDNAAAYTVRQIDGFPETRTFFFDNDIKAANKFYKSRPGMATDETQFFYYGFHEFSHQLNVQAHAATKFRFFVDDIPNMASQHKSIALDAIEDGFTEYFTRDALRTRQLINNTHNYQEEVEVIEALEAALNRGIAQGKVLGGLNGKERLRDLFYGDGLKHLETLMEQGAVEFSTKLMLKMRADIIASEIAGRHLPVYKIEFGQNTISWLNGLFP